MYIKTPKKYRGRQRRSVFSLWRFLLSVGMLGLIIIGIGIYQNRAALQPQIDRIAGTLVSDIGERAATAAAPAPTATIDPTTRLVSGDNAWEQGDINGAIREYEAVIDSLPNDVAVHSRLTIGLATSGELAKALDYAERTVTADPLDASAWATRAFVLVQDERPREAIASALQALDLDPENAIAMAFLAYAYNNADQPQVANSRAEDAIELNPERFEGYWVRGIVREESLFDFEGALEDYEFAYDLALVQNPALAGSVAVGIAQQQLRFALNSSGDYTAALNTLEGILESNPDHISALYWLGYTHFRYRGDPNQAFQPLQDCVEADPDNIACVYMLGRTQARLGDQVAAYELFDRAVELDTSFARHYWWAANMQVALGSCSSAAPYLETGFRMVMPGDLPADDEGVQELIDAFDALISQCRLNIGGVVPPAPTAEATRDPANQT